MVCYYHCKQYTENISCGVLVEHGALCMLICALEIFLLTKLIIIIMSTFI